MTRAPGQSEITKRRQPRWRTAGLVLFFSLIALAFTRAAYVQFGYWGIQDWDIFFFYHGAPAVVVRDFHQFPLWNPWFCGGMPMLARPESPILSPLFLLTLWLGAVHGLKVQIVLHLVGGLCGTYVLARHLACSRLAAVLAAFVYMLGGAYAQHMAVGNAWAFSMGFMPWAVWCWLKAQASAERASRFALACAAVLVLMWFSGAPYPMVITLLFFGAHTLIGIAMREWRPRPALRVLLTVTLLTFGLGAIKFLPSLEFTMQYPRVAEMSTGFSLDSLRHGLFARDQTLHAAEAWRHGPGFLHGVSQAMNETGSYLGLAPFCLFVIGAVSQAKRRRALLLCLLLFLWLGFGVRAPLSIWNVLHDLPVFSITRVAERFRLIFLLLVAIFAAFGLDRLSASVRKRAAWGRAPDAVAALVVLGVWVDLMLVVAPLFAQAFTIQPLTMPPAPGRAFAQTASHYAIGPRGWATAEDDQTLSAWSSHYPALLSNLGVILGNEDTPVPKEALAVDAPDYRGEVYLHGTTGTASFTRWSPNVLAIRARATGEGYVVVNQNYYPGWRVKGAPGRRVEAVDRLLAVRVGPGEHTLTLTYRPTSFMLGAGLSLATLAACVWWLRRLRHAQPAPAWCLALAARVPRDLTPATRIALALAAITLCVYLPALQADFVNIDDDIYVTDNAHVKTGLTWANVGWAFTATERANYWHPLTWLSHMLDVELYGLRAAGHHLTSVLLHVLNTVLLFWVLRMLTRGGAAHGAATTVCGCAGSAVVAPPCGALYPAAFVAALFALHPLHVESVAWIAERKDVLSTLFWILTLGAYGRYCRMQIADCRLTDGRRAPLSVSNLQSSIGNRQCRAWYILTLLCFLLGLMAKPMLVTLPLVLLLLDYWPLRRGWKPVSSFISLLLEKLPFLLLALGASAWAFAAQREGEALRSLAQVPLGERVANALVSYGIYLFQTFWPRGLTIYYPLSDAARPLWQPISAALALAVVTGAVLWQARRRPYLFTGWFWYLITLLPVIGLVQIGTFAHADRYTYVPLIGVFIALAWGAQELQIADCRLQIGRRRKAAPLILNLQFSLCTILLLVCAVLTWQQLKVWKSSTTLFTHNLRVVGSNAVAQDGLGEARLSKGRYDEAVPHFEESVRLFPDAVRTRFRLGRALAGAGRPAEAIAAYEDLLALADDYADAWLNLGVLRMQQGDVVRATDCFQQAARHAPDNAQAFSNLGIALCTQGQLLEGLRHLQESARLAPENAESRNNVGRALLLLGRAAEAEAALRQALKLKPSYTDAHRNLAEVLARAGQQEEAEVHAREAQRLAAAAAREMEGAHDEP